MVRLSTLLTLAAAGLGAQGTLPPPTLTLAHEPAAISLVRGAVRPTISAMINGKGPYELIFDTGAGGGMIDSALARTLGLDVVGRSRVASPGGAATEIDIVGIPSVSLGDATLGNLNVSAFPIRSRGLPGDGVLSYRVFAGAVFSVDLAAGTLTLSHESLRKGAPGVVEYSIDHGLIALPGNIGSRNLALHLDTGNPSTITLPRALMDSLPLKSAPVAGPDVRMISGPRHTWNAQLDGLIRVAGVDVRDPAITFIDLDVANVGSAFVRQFVVTIDQDQHLVRLVQKANAPRSADNLTLSTAARYAILDTLALQLRRFYVRPAVAESLISILARREAAGAFDAASTPAIFTSQIEREIRTAIRDDAHLGVRYSPPETPPSSSVRTPAEEYAARVAARDAFTEDARAENFGIPDVRTLEGNVGYIHVGEFLYQTMAGAAPFALPTFLATLKFVAERDALIVDLRDNRGGHTSAPPVLLRYFFDKPVTLGTSRARDGTVTQNRLEPDPSQPTFGAVKPVYVLTSDSTFSAGEGIAAALQATGRAKVVGARTRGGASSGDFHPIGAGIRAFIPDTENFDAQGHTLESVGVAPDVHAAPKDALDVAYRMAIDSLAKTANNPGRREKLNVLAQRLRQGAVRG